MTVRALSILRSLFLTFTNTHTHTSCLCILFCFGFFQLFSHLAGISSFPSHPCLSCSISYFRDLFSSLCKEREGREKGRKEGTSLKHWSVRVARDLHIVASERYPFCFKSIDMGRSAQHLYKPLKATSWGPPTLELAVKVNSSSPGSATQPCHLPQPPVAGLTCPPPRGGGDSKRDCGCRSIPPVWEPDGILQIWLFCFAPEKTKAQRGEVTCSRLHSELWGRRADLTGGGGYCPGGLFLFLSVWFANGEWSEAGKGRKPLEICLARAPSSAAKSGHVETKYSVSLSVFPSVSVTHINRLRHTHVSWYKQHKGSDCPLQNHTLFHWLWGNLLGIM